MNMIPISKVYNMDCVAFMREYPDKFFDLAVVDTPYGIGVKTNMGRRKGVYNANPKAKWDSEPPTTEYFTELFRVSKNQIIWGANHFIDLIPYRSPCWIAWDKTFSNDVSFASFELAWTSFKSVSKKYTEHPNLQGKRIHPTQKPISLYEWILKYFAQKGDKILDTHLGSGSSRIAAHKLGFDFYGCEIDKDYFEQSEKRFKDAVFMPLFDVPFVPQQLVLV